MKIIPDGPGTLRAVMETLVRLPEPVRAFALERVAIFVHGVTSLGSSIDTATALEGRDWLVNVTAYAGLQETLMHELAHSWLAHRGTPTADYEREASALAASWGARGSGADPDWGVANFRQWIAPTPRARTTDDIISIECSACGDECFVLSPTAAGLPARVGIQCRCGIGAITLASVALCSCGATASVVWAEGATPTHPVAEWRCDACGARQTRGIWSGPDPTCPMPTRAPDPNLSYADSLLIQAGDVLQGLDGSLRCLDPAVDADGVAWESCRSALVWGHTLMRKTLRELDPTDPRGPFVEDVAAELVAACRALSVGDPGVAADAAGRAARALTAMLQRAEITQP